LPGLASLIQKQMPEIMFQVTEGPSERLRSWVSSGELDIALVPNATPNRALHVMRLWREALALAAPPRLGGRSGPMIADVHHLPFILTSRKPDVR
jgi:DNA-binding transcriptional LysR family regulator